MDLRNKQPAINNSIFCEVFVKPSASLWYFVICVHVL